MHRALGFIVASILLVSACGGGNPASTASATQSAVSSLAAQQSASASAVTSALAAAVSAASAAQASASTTTAATTAQPATSTTATTFSPSSTGTASAITTASSALTTATQETATSVAANASTAAVSSATTSSAATSASQAATTAAGPATLITGTAACASTYLPIKLHFQHVYTVHGVVDTPFQETSTITEVKQNSFTEETDEGDGVLVDSYWACTDAGMNLVGTNTSPGGPIDPSSLIAVTATTGVLVPRDSDWAVGKTWTETSTIHVPGAQADDSPVMTKIDFTIAAQESVTVKAGTFNAYKVTGVETTDTTTKDASGKTTPLHILTHLTMWYVANIGLVKQMSDLGDTTSAPGMWELDSYKG